MYLRHKWRSFMVIQRMINMEGLMTENEVRERQECADTMIDDIVKKIKEHNVGKSVIEEIKVTISWNAIPSHSSDGKTFRGFANNIVYSIEERSIKNQTTGEEEKL